MSASTDDSGYLSGGLPFTRFGRGPRPLVVFLGLMFENKPMPANPLTRRFSGFNLPGDEFSVYLVNRKPGLPTGYTMKDMAFDYAAMIRAEFGGPVDVIGTSTGGSIVQHFAADHPNLLRRLVIHSSAWKLPDKSREFQLLLARLGSQGRWRETYATTARWMMIRGEKKQPLQEAVIALGSRLAAVFASPKDASDLVVTVEAEDKHDFRARLPEITAPTLVAAGDQDPFYTPQLFRETAEGIPNAVLKLYQGIGHPASGKQFDQDLLAFLRAE